MPEFDPSLFPEFGKTTKEEGAGPMLSAFPEFREKYKEPVPVPKEPSYLEAARLGLKESIYGGLRRFEAPFKPIARAMGIPLGLEASELFRPTEEEIKKPYTIPQQIVRGLAGAPATIASYAPYISALGPIGGFMAPEAMETIAEGRPIPEVARRVGEAAALGAGFKYLPPALRYRVPGMAALFGGQAFYETGEPREAIAPAVVGGLMGLLGRERRPIARAEPGFEPTPEQIPEPTPRMIPTIPESRYMMGTYGWPRTPDLPYPVVPYRPQPIRQIPYLGRAVFGEGFTMEDVPVPPILRPQPSVPFGREYIIDSVTGEPVYVPPRAMTGMPAGPSPIGTPGFMPMVEEAKIPEPPKPPVAKIPLEGTPLIEAAKRAELERVQPRLPIEEPIPEERLTLRDLGYASDQISRMSNIAMARILKEKIPAERASISPEGELSLIEPAIGERPLGPEFRPALRINGETVIGEANQAHFQLEQKLPPGWWNKKLESGWIDSKGNWIPIEEAWSIRARMGEKEAEIPLPKSFREFAESRGKKWPLESTDPDYSIIKDEWDRLERTGYTGTEVSAKELKKGDRLLKRGELYTVTEKTKNRMVIKDGETYEIDPKTGRIQGHKLEKGEVPFTGPGAESVYEREVTEPVFRRLITPGIETIRSFRDGVTSLLFPGAKSSLHLEAAQDLASNLGSFHRDVAIAAKSLREDWKIFAKLGTFRADIPIAENPGMKFGSNMSVGRKMDFLETDLGLQRGRLQQIVDRANRVFADDRRKLEQAGAPIETVRPNYFPGIWTEESVRAFNQALNESMKMGNGIADKIWTFNRTKELIRQGGGTEGAGGLEYILARRPFKGREAFRKEKIFDDIMDAAEWGLEPKSLNPVDLINYKHAEIQKSLMANRTLREWESKDRIVNVNNSGLPFKKGLREIFDRAKYDRIRDPYGTIWHLDENTGLLSKIGERLAEKPFAEVLNNYLSSSLYNNPHFGKFYAGYMWTAGVLNQAQLGMGSMFHAGFTSGEQQIISNADVMKNIYGLMVGNRTTSDLIASIKRVPTAMGRWMTEGKRIMSEWESPTMEVPIDIPVSQLTQTKEGKIAIISKALELGGGKFEIEHGLRTREIDAMVRNWYAGKKIRAAIRSPFAFVEMTAKPIMEWLVPKQKAVVFGEKVGWIIEQNPDKTLKQLMPEFRKALNFTDASMGQVGWDRIFMNNAAKNIVQAVFRAPGWTGGTIAQIAGGFKDAGKFMSDIVRTGKMPAELPDRAAYVLSLMVTVGLANALLTIGFTGDKPSDLEPMDFWAFRTGGTDEYGRRERFLLPTYAKDVYAWQHNFAQTLLNKTHPMVSLIGDIRRNKDYYGVKIYDPGDDLFSRGLDEGGYVAKQFIPFWMRGISVTAERAGGLAEAMREHPIRTVLPEIGVMPAPAAYTMSRAEALARELSSEKFPIGGMPKQRREKLDLIKKYEKQFRQLQARGEDTTDIFASIQNDLALGKLNRADLLNFRQRITREPIEQSILRLNLKEALRVWETATSEEKLKIKPYIIRKFRATKSPEEREEMMPKIQKIVEGG